MLLPRLLLLPLALLVLPSANAHRRVQHPDLVQSALSKQRAEEVRDVFVDAYLDYRAYAWGHDEVSPMGRGAKDSRNGWGATIIDSMDTMLLMNLTDLFEEAVSHVRTVDFTHSRTHSAVSVFESIIRYVGGLVSAYELTDGRYPGLLAQAERLSEKLAFGWRRSRGNMTYTYVDFETDEPVVQTIGLATAGSSILEFSKLSKYTGNATYLSLSKRSMRAVFQTPQWRPGLFGMMYNPRNDRMTDDKVTFGPNSDSFFEYLIKYAHLTGNAEPEWLDTWLAGVDSAIGNLVFSSTVGNWTYLSDHSTRAGHEFITGHLACYAGGNWLLGGRLAQNSTIMAYGLALAEGCAHSYAASPLGIGPETWSYVPQGPRGKKVPGKGLEKGTRAWEEYVEKGFWTTDGRFVLRPEVVETMFYAYRITGDPIWQDRVYNAFRAVKRHCKAPISYASLVSMQSLKPMQKDESESFFYAELLKYFYLTFADPNVLHLDHFTITTEAHPFYLDTPTFNYGADLATDPHEPIIPSRRDPADRPPQHPPARPPHPRPLHPPGHLRPPPHPPAKPTPTPDCTTREGTVMSYLMMLTDFYVPVLERCAPPR